MTVGAGQHTESAPQLIEAVIFDLDGVLADTEPVHLETTRRILAPAVMPEDEYLGFVGSGPDEFGAHIESRYGVSSEVFYPRYTDMLVEMLATGPAPAMDGADAIVRAVHRRGLRVAVASMSRRPWVDATLAAIGLTHLIPLIVTGEEVEFGKPAPDIYLLTASLLGVEPAACLVVEDSANGVAAAVAAGMWVVQTRHGTIPAEPHPEAHAVIDAFSAFDLRWLEGQPLSRE